MLLQSRNNDGGQAVVKFSPFTSIKENGEAQYYAATKGSALAFLSTKDKCAYLYKVIPGQNPSTGYTAL